MNTALELQGYRGHDPLDDAVAEFAELTGVAGEEGVATVERVLAWYHEGHSDYPAGLDRTLADLAIHLTQPYRIPVMTTRVNRLLESLAQTEGLETLLDYGGGGGKDSIIFARAGFRVTYCDLLDTLTPYVRRRFELRGLEVDVVDVRDLGGARFDVINCMDVIEHVYDVEYVVADIAARLRLGGQLLCYPAFFNSWNGDHVEKNCGYTPYFTRMLEAIGFEVVDEFDPHGASAGRAGRFLFRVGLRDREMPVLRISRARPLSGSVAEERERFRQELYRLSRRFSIRRAAASAALLPAVALSALLVPVPKLRRKGRNTSDRLLSSTIDNLAIWRLSRQRLSELERKG